MNSFADILALWDTTAAFGADIGVSAMHARAMKRRQSIPPEYWPATVMAAKRRGIQGISIEMLAGLRAARWPGSYPVEVSLPNRRRVKRGVAA